MSAVLELVNNFFQRITERRIGASEIECEKLTSATATQCALIDVPGSEWVTADATKGIFDCLDLVPTGLADNTKGGFVDNVVTQPAGTGKNDT